MEHTINSSYDLREAIHQLEIQQKFEGGLLRENFFLFTESLKPINLIKSAFHETIDSQRVFESLLSNAIGLVTGYFSSKILVGTSRNLVKKMIGNLLQLGVTNLINNNSQSVISFGQKMFQRFFHREKDHKEIVEGQTG